MYVIYIYVIYIFIRTYCMASSYTIASGFFSLPNANGLEVGEQGLYFNSRQ